jgi:hypothetical protein
MAFGLTTEQLAAVEVGDKVGVERLGNVGDMRAVGTVDRITPSRSKFVVVTASGTTYEFNKYGEIRGGTWDPTTYMVEADDAFIAKIKDMRLARRINRAGRAMTKSSGLPAMDAEQREQLVKALTTIEQLFAA